MTFTPRCLQSSTGIPQWNNKCYQQEKKKIYSTHSNAIFAPCSHDGFSCILYFLQPVFLHPTPSTPFLATQEKAGGTGYFLKVLAVEGTWSLLYAKLPSEDSGFKWLFHTLGSSVPEWCSIGEVPHSVNQIVLHLCNPDLKTRYFRANHCFCSSAVHGAFTFTYEHLICIMS